jgi:hypothetical protein
MGLFSGLPQVKDWVTATRPYSWIKSLRDDSFTSFKKWKDVQNTQGEDTVHTSNQFMSKFKLVKKLKK